MVGAAVMSAAAPFASCVRGLTMDAAAVMSPRHWWQFAAILAKQHERLLGDGLHTVAMSALDTLGLARTVLARMWWLYQGIYRDREIVLLTEMSNFATSTRWTLTETHFTAVLFL